MEEEENEEAQEEAPKDEAAIEVGGVRRVKHHHTSWHLGIAGMMRSSES